VMTFLKILFWSSLFFTVYSYVVYPLLLSLFARIFARPVATDDAFCPSVAVLVPVFNEESVIRAKINNILALDYPPDRLSIWVGSDCSTDATHDIVRGFPDSRIHLWIAPRRGGKTEVLNQLAPMVKADVLLFTDANTMHHGGSVRKMVRSFADPAVGGVAGLIKHRSDDPEPEEVLYRSFEARQKFLESRLHSSISAFGGFYSIRSSLFRPIRPNAYSNDDVLIPMNVIRQKHRVIFDPDAVSEEDMTDSIKHEFTRRIRIGAGNFQAFFWLLDFLNPMQGWPWFCYFSHKVTRWFSPFLFGTVFICGTILLFMGAPVMYSLFSLIGMAIIAAGMSFLVFPFAITRPLFYFLSMNTALALGLFRFCTGIKSAAWSRTERK
jgi:cellulose synthase/poly-beta-1,6-N-acetylglucosamine synthase-like glycosyltransferase